MAKEFDLNKYSKLFVTEAREYLRTLNDSMVELEKRPEDKELIDQMFRACHTIKGMASMMNLVAVTETAHALEDVLGAIRDGRLSASPPVAEGIFTGLDGLESMVSQVETTLDIKEVPGLVERLRGLISNPPPTKKERKKKAEAPKPPKDQAGEPKDKRRVMVIVRLARRCALPSARAMVIVKELEKNADVVETSPSEADIENERPFEELTVLLDPRKGFEESVSRVGGMTDVEDVRWGAQSEPRESWARHSKQDRRAGTPDAPLVQTVKVGMDKLDELLDDVGELVIGRSRLTDKAGSGDDYELQEISSLIDNLTSEIQSKVLSIRMIPLDIVMSRFPRMVRDISKAEGKEVEFVVEGGGIELDRTVVDRIADPVMHIIRNSIDHGIETPEERAKAGKNPKGLIRVVASKQQDHVLIEITDDGRGIDFDRIRQTAVEKGHMTRENADSATGRELLDLLFKAGFSTKKEVTETSGRGVGLDVVKKGVEDLGGSVMVSTAKGSGSTISLWLPFTLAIIDAMMTSVA
ncbi:MAG: two-component system, chemotaxis family, sensor kinase CheA, partial [Candidatus Thermoplasmatota archaeon]|nr:two-component system, chemotaxis family, sensor kinase CheA [Candidatus Thermoplasmatota archaeon]